MAGLENPTDHLRSGEDRWEVETFSTRVRGSSLEELIDQDERVGGDSSRLGFANVETSQKRRNCRVTAGGRD